MWIPKTPKFIQNAFDEAIWSIPTKEKELYLTFDDGPNPLSTSFALRKLKKFDAKATFFCVGENVERNIDIFQQVIHAGHTVGNHSYSHKNGWYSDNDSYYNDIDRASKLIDSPYFRPPYGKLKYSQYKFLKSKFKIVMWDVLAEDYKASMTAKDCVEKIKKQALPGSVIVLHDNDKFYEKLRVVLPEILEHFSAQGFVFKPFSRAN